jgi:hypothetical protein
MDGCKLLAAKGSARAKYLDALKRADNGDLAPLMQFAVTTNLN